MEVINCLRELRTKRGISAVDLAAKTGVTRQTIHAIESGAYAPNTTLALKLARELSVGIHDIFQLPNEEAPARQTAEVVGSEVYAGAPLRLCRVDEKLVAVPWMPEAFAVPPTDAMALVDSVDGRVTAELLAGRGPDENRLLIAGCDPAVSTLAENLLRLAGVELIPVPSSSRKALLQLEAGLVHLAGTHLSKSAAQIPAGTRVFTFAEWEEGLVVARGNPKGIHGFADLAKPGVRIVNREVGAGSRALLDDGLAKAGVEGRAISGYERMTPGHLSAAAAVLRGTADCCVTPRIAARIFGLDFIPQLSERYELAIPEQRLGLPAVRALLDVLQRAGFRRELEALGGYDTAATGTEVH